MIPTARHICRTWWREVFKKVKKAVVFIDNEAAECLHWNGGLFELISAGAVSVKEFSSFESGEESQKKAVFVTSSSRLDRSRVILQDIISSSSFEYCVLVTAVSPSVHHFAKYGGFRDGVTDMSLFHGLEEDMLHWMGNVNFTVEIFHFPLFLVPVTDNLFLMPPFQKLFPLMESDLIRIRELQRDRNKPQDGTVADSLSTLELAMLPKELQISVRHLAACIHSLLTTLDMREDLFSMGALSGLLASHLEAMPAAINRRKNAANHCSFILIDRTLDLVTPTSHGSESLLDRILNVLPRLPGHSNDVAVNMSPLCSAKVTSVLDDMFLAPGCLAHTDVQPCPQVMEWLINKRHKDVLLRLHQYLTEATPTGGDNCSTRLVTRITPHALEKQAAAFKGSTEAIAGNCGLLQQTLAVTQTLKSSHISHLDQLLSLEKLLLLELVSGRDDSSAHEQMRKLIQTRHERGLSFDDLLGLLVHLYSLAGTDVKFSTSDERQLRTALLWALIEDKEKLNEEITGLVPPDADEATVDEMVTNIISKLHNIAQARKDLTKYGSLLNRRSPTQDGVFSSLMQRLFVDLCDPTRPTVVDLNCRSSGIKELLKSSFSLLLNRPRQQHPLENPMLIVLVLGGVTAQEVRMVEATVAGATNVLVGGTSLITPTDIVKALFIQDSLMQDES